MSPSPALPCRGALAAFVLLVSPGAATAQRPASPPRDTVLLRTTETRVERRVETGATRTTMRTGAAALARFRPLVAPFDSAGECVTRDEPRPGVRQISVYYPARRNARSLVVVTVDSAGELLRYTERRGRVALPLPNAASDSLEQALLAEFRREPTTSITMDLVTGRGSVTNAGGEAPGEGVSTSAAELLDSEPLGRPAARARAALARCGARDLRIAPALRAARTSSETLPRDVVSALYAGGTPGRLTLRVGAPSPELDAAALPPDAEVLGSAIVSGRPTTALLVDTAPDSARAALERQLLASGWTRPPEPVSSGIGERGFVSSSVRRRLQPQGLCGPDAHLTYAASRWSDGRTLLRIVRAPIPASGWSVCRPQDAAARSRMMPSDSIVPRLEAPPGTVVLTGGGGGGTARWESHAVVDGSIATAELLRHYAAQLRTQGWTLVEEAPGQAIATQLWRKQGSGEHEGRWFATLLVSDRSGGARHALELIVEREDRP